METIGILSLSFLFSLNRFRKLILFYLAQKIKSFFHLFVHFAFILPTAQFLLFSFLHFYVIFITKTIFLRKFS
ncbi:hypothetical protein BRYFOR_06865 [Marvinbryantia formatexigens DSM 14469]|uniref:Uncharacterized protein n=1 Tax=Marvinbryantia formatexigens DSM 14469 TaxID=478749 RepID=C6LE15_9FIRM|nr:hypothetical protein BRYFOR_06865 [Marvinbryantia formatexigens DSM 14469]